MTIRAAGAMTIAVTDRGAVMTIAMTYRGTMMAGTVTCRGTVMAGACWRSRVVEVMMGVEACPPMVVSTTVAHEHGRAVHEHPVVMVTTVDGEGPAPSIPNKRTVEVGACQVAVVLHRAEHEAQVAVAQIPPGSEHVGT